MKNKYRKYSNKYYAETISIEMHWGENADGTTQLGHKDLRGRINAHSQWCRSFKLERRKAIKARRKMKHRKIENKVRE